MISRRIRMLCYGGVFLLLAGTAFAAENHAEAPDMTHRMMMLALQLGVIVFAARFGNILFEKLKLPGVVGELIAGVLIGPSVLGALPLPGFPAGLFHVPESISTGAIPVSPELYGLCAVASIVLLFMVGLETDIGLFMRYSLAGSLVGIGGVTISFLAGDLMAMAFSPMLFGKQMGFMDAPCLFLGIISTATSVGITARILSEKRKLDSPEGVTILSGAVIDDVLGIILLAIGMGIISASKGTGSIDWKHIGIIAFKAVSIWLAATAIGLLASRKISTLLKGFKDKSVIAVMALALAMILAALFEEAGLAMIIGAYVMGLSLSKTDLNHVIREKLHSISVFLVPVFFTVMGMLVDIRALASKEVLLFGLLYTAVAAAAKILGCGGPALLANFNIRGALRIGAGMLPRGEVTLIIAGTGLAAGVLNPKIFGVVVFMTFCAAFIAPPTLVALFKNPASGLRNPPETSEEKELVFSFPSFNAAELLINKLLRAFEAEGCFVHTLSRSDRLFQLRKEDMVITFQQRQTDIVFECKKTQTAFISTAMLEVVADLEGTIRELRKPLDKDVITKRLQEGQIAPARASLQTHLSPNLMIPSLKGTTKEEVIDELLLLLDKHNNINNFDELRHAVISREESMSTGMEHGVAIPHGRTDAVDKLTCAIGIKPTGVDFDSLDGKPTRIIVLTISPKTKAAPHMQFMSMISQMLDERGRTELLSCDTAKDMYTVFTTPTSPKETSVSHGRAVLNAIGLTRKTEPTLSRFLSKDRFITKLAGTTKQEIIDELIELLNNTGCISSVEEVHKAIMTREEQMSTGMEHGVAIPHARTDAVNELVCAIGIKKEGIDFGSLDDKPSNIFILTLTPTRSDAPHVQFMAMISRALDKNGRKQVLSAKNPNDLWKALVE